MDGGVDFSARDHNRAPETFYKLDWVAGKAERYLLPPRAAHRAALRFARPAECRTAALRERRAKQDGRSTDMIFTVAEQIATASRIMTLDPGDVLLTGTPAGVGVPKGTFLPWAIASMRRSKASDNFRCAFSRNAETSQHQHGG